MKTKFTPYFVDLIYDACLKSFWRKKALANFLRRCRISESFFSGWDTDETKRDLLDRLFEKLPQTDEGRLALLRITKNLMEQKSFPDLQNWEDSSMKIKQAYDAVLKLKIYHQEQEEEIRTEEEKQKARKEFQNTQDEIKRSQTSLQKLNDNLNELGQRIGTQKAGYDFQDWFYNLLDFFEITNRKPYVHDGRQIDGSLTLSSTTYLIELKFTTEQAGVTDIDSFYRKVTSKADNTMGITVSISGYSAIAIKEASGEKTPLLLLDHNHLYYALGGIMGMADIIERIRRHASQTCEAYLPIQKFEI